MSDNERCNANWPGNAFITCARAVGHDGRHCNSIGHSQYGEDFLAGATVWPYYPGAGLVRVLAESVPAPQEEK